MNSRSSVDSSKFNTTEQAFWTKMHICTICDAISDVYVLLFRKHCVNTIKANRSREYEINGIDTDAALLEINHAKAIVSYTLKHFI